MSRYPLAEWVPWAYSSGSGPTYYKGMNAPVAAVLHVQQGYVSTARAWALGAHFGASWHYTVGRDGSVMQHLEHTDGGYHAGIPNTAPAPTWPLWRGHGQNVNCYTIGIEHEGFSGDGFTIAQAEASRALCLWLAQELGFPYDRDHFPPHADIDLINRANDFAPPDGRTVHYAYMFGGDDMPDPRVDALVAALTGLKGSDPNALAVLEQWNRNGNSLLAGYAAEQQKLAGHLANHLNPSPGTIADHTHEPGGVKK